MKYKCVGYILKTIRFLIFFSLKKWAIATWVSLGRVCGVGCPNETALWAWAYSILMAWEWYLGLF